MFKKLSIITSCFVLVLLYMPRLSADDNTPGQADVIDMIAGDIQIVAVHHLTRVSVTNPDVADISDAKDEKVSLLAKKAGETALFLWDDNGKRSIKVRVVNEDLNALKDRVEKVVQEAGVTGVSFEVNLDAGKLVASGDLGKDDKNRLSDVLEPYSDNILNLVKEEKNEDLIEVDMQVIEISTTLVENLGIAWNSAVAGSESTPTSAGEAATGFPLPYVETPPSTNGKIGDFFKIGQFNRAFQLQATVNALLQEGKARLISKPRLVVVSGKQASFLVGGEIPIQSTTLSSAGGGTATTGSTTYTQYGVNMTVTPTIRKSKINVLLNVDIRDVDNSSSFSSSTNGNEVAFITRTATTELLMDNKQTIALAGLIKYQNSETLTEVPFLGKIPVLGALFRDRSKPADTSTEMVIILTPVVLTDKKISDRQVVMPTPAERDANNEINAKYEQEPLPAWPLPKIAADNNLQTVLPEMTAYARMVQEKISNAIRYPQGRALAGTVKLKLRILKDGSLNSEEVLESSGNAILDQDAMQAAKTAAPYNAFTPGIDQDDLIFTIPIVYNKLIPGAKATADKVIATY